MTSSILSSHFLMGQRERTSRRWKTVWFHKVRENILKQLRITRVWYESILEKIYTFDCWGRFFISCLSGSCFTHLFGGQIGRKISGEQSSFIHPANMVILEVAQGCIAHWLLFAVATALLQAQILTTHFLFSTALIPLQKQHKINFRKCKWPGHGIITTSCFLHLFFFSSGFKTHLRRTP